MSSYRTSFDDDRNAIFIQALFFAQKAINIKSELKATIVKNFR